MNKMDQLEGEADAKRAAAARSGYIAWRMADLPSIYCDLMPVAYDAQVLVMAEKSIRFQVEQDKKLLASPWRRVGPASGLLDFNQMTAQEKTAFALELEVPIGLADAPKPGRWNDPEVLAAFETAKSSPEFKAAVEYGDACVARQETVRVLKEAEVAGADAATLNKLFADVEAAQEKVNQLLEKTPRLGKVSFNLPLSEYGKPNNWRK